MMGLAKEISMIDIDKLLKNGKYIDEFGQLWIKLYYGNERIEWHVENVRIKSALPPGISDAEFKEQLNKKLNNIDEILIQN